MRARDMTPAQLIAYDALDKLECAVAEARRQVERGDFDVDTMRLLNRFEQVEDAFADEKCEPTGTVVPDGERR